MLRQALYGTLRMDDRQSERLLKRHIVAISVKQAMAVRQAECGDEAINSFSHRLAPLPQPSKVTRGCNRQVYTTHFKYFKSEQLPLRAGE